MRTLLQSELDSLVKLDDLEVFTPDQLKSYVDEAYAEINKSISGQDKLREEVALEIRSFKPVTVVDDNTLEKSIKLIRPAQIRWDEPDPNDIEKARAGTYLNTHENRKLGRVGQRYGENIEKSLNEDDIQKGGKPASIGETRIWQGKKYQKQSNGKWLEVSEKGMTKKQHDEKRKEIYKDNFGTNGGFRKRELMSKHKEQASKLSNKELSDEDLEAYDKEPAGERGDKNEEAKKSGVTENDINFSNEFDELKKKDKKELLGILSQTMKIHSMTEKDSASEIANAIVNDRHYKKDWKYVPKSKR